MDKPLILIPGQIWQRNQEDPMHIVSIKGDVVYLHPINGSVSVYVSTIQALLTEKRWKFIK